MKPIQLKTSNVSSSYNTIQTSPRHQSRSLFTSNDIPIKNNKLINNFNSYKNNTSSQRNSFFSSDKERQQTLSSSKNRMKIKVLDLTDRYKSGNLPTELMNRTPKKTFKLWEKASITPSKKIVKDKIFEFTDNKKDKEKSLFVSKKNKNKSLGYMKTMSLFNDYKPKKRYFISNLNYYNGLFNLKRLPIKGNFKNFVCVAETQREKEIKDLHLFGNFTLEEKRDVEKKSNYLQEF